MLTKKLSIAPLCLLSVIACNNDQKHKTNTVDNSQQSSDNREYPIAATFEDIFLNTTNVTLYGKLAKDNSVVEISRTEEEDREFAGQLFKSIKDNTVVKDEKSARVIYQSSNSYLYSTEPHKVVALLNTNGSKIELTEHGELPEMAKIGVSGFYNSGKFYESNRATDISQSWSLHELDGNFAELCLKITIDKNTKATCYKINQQGRVFGKKIELSIPSKIFSTKTAVFKTKGYDIT